MADITSYQTNQSFSTKRITLDMGETATVIFNRGAVAWEGGGVSWIGRGVDANDLDDDSFEWTAGYSLLPEGDEFSAHPAAPFKGQRQGCEKARIFRMRFEATEGKVVAEIASNRDFTIELA